MSDLLNEMEPLAQEMRKQVLNELGQRVTPLVAPPWDELRKQIGRLDAVLQEANGWRAKDRQGAVVVGRSFHCLVATPSHSVHG